MNKKNIIPQLPQPLMRLTQGTQAHLLAELSEENLSSTLTAVRTAFYEQGACIEIMCSFDGEDAE